MSRSNRYGRVRLDSIPELPLEAAGTAGLQNLESFSVSELKAPEEGVEETVVYFNTDSGLGIGIEGVTIQGALEEVTNIEGVTIQAIGSSEYDRILESAFSIPRSGDGCGGGGAGLILSTNRRGNNSDMI